MKKELKSTYLKIDSGKNTLVMYRDAPRRFSLIHRYLKNAVITFTEDGTIKVNGDEIQWGWVAYKTFVEDLDDKPDEAYTNLGYKNVIDFFKGVKNPYVKAGWHKLDKTEKFNCEMSQWFIVFD